MSCNSSNCNCGCNCNCNCCEKTPCGCASITDTNCVKYTGTNLDCLGVTSGDKLEDILSRVDEVACVIQSFTCGDLDGEVIEFLTLENINNWNALGDITITDVADGETLVYNSTTESWENTTIVGGGGATNLGDLLDVTLGALADGEVLTYNSGLGIWENQPSAGGSDGNGIYDGSGTLGTLNTVVTIPTGGTFEFLGDFVGTLFSIDGDTGKITIDGLLDPIGLQFTQTASNPGDPNTLWTNSADSKLYFGTSAFEIANWNTAFGWGDHSTVGYLTTETDPLFTASEASNFAAGDKAKLDAIEAGADVTDAASVDAAGAVMNTDTSTAAMSFVVDEDNMVSNSDTLIPTQQSVKAYVDNLVVTGSTLKEAVDLATTAALPANTAAGSGVGKTLTGDANGALVVDGFTVLGGERILVKDETPDTDNGIYVVTQTGDGATPYILTRATDYDNTPTGEIKEGNLVYVLDLGTVNSFTGWRQTSPDVVTIETDPITFVQFQGLPTLSHTQNTDTGTTSSTWDINTTGNTAQIQTGLLTGNQAYDLPDATGTIALTSDILTTNLAVANKTATTLDVTSSDGTDATIPSATITEAGLMSSTDKTKLDGVASGANNYTHPNHTGEVTSTGDGATVVDSTAITNKTTITAESGDFVLVSDTSDSGNLKKVDVADLLTASTPATNDLGNVTGNVDIDFTTSRTFNMVLTGDVDIDILNLPDGETISIAIFQDAVGGHTVTWNDAAVVWSDQITPVQTATALADDMYTITNILGRYRASRLPNFG